MSELEQRILRGRAMARVLDEFRNVGALEAMRRVYAGKWMAERDEKERELLWVKVQVFDDVVSGMDSLVADGLMAEQEAERLANG